MMGGIGWVCRRELGSYFRALWGWGILSAVLMVQGLLFNAFAVGTTPRLSSQVLEIFFYNQSGTTLLVAIFLSMRLLAEERQSGTWAVLATSPLKERDIVLGKFMGAWLYLLVLNACTLYMPLLVALHGKISWGHIAIGYVGEMLLGAATLALGLLCSALAPNQLMAAVSTSVTVATFILLWLLARIASPPFAQVLSYLSLHDRHFRPFMRGIVSVNDVVFYLTLTYVALTAAIRATEARRWQ
jgi:ABC-2 type transport system permease protein